MIRRSPAVAPTICSFRTYFLPTEVRGYNFLIEIIKLSTPTQHILKFDLINRWAKRFTLLVAHPPSRDQRYCSYPFVGAEEMTFVLIDKKCRNMPSLVRVGAARQIRLNLHCDIRVCRPEKRSRKFHSCAFAAKW